MSIWNFWNPLVRLESNWHPTVCTMCVEQRHTRCEIEKMEIPCDCSQSHHQLIPMTVQQMCRSVIRLPMENVTLLQHLGAQELQNINLGGEFYSIRCGLGRHTRSLYDSMIFGNLPRVGWGGASDPYSLSQYRVQKDMDAETMHQYHDPMGRTIRWPGKMGIDQEPTPEEILEFLANHD